jgi:hypothetical protein
MRRRRRVWMRRITKVVATVAIGAMLGFLVPSTIADFTPEPAVQARIARQFIRAYLADDQGALDALGIAADLKLRASTFRAEFARIDEPVHLGSYIGGGFTLHAYAAATVRADGTQELFGFRIATAGGNVILIDPPPLAQQP